MTGASAKHPALLALVLAISVSTVGCEKDAPIEPGSLGRIVVDVSPDNIDATWTLRGPTGYTHNGQGDESMDGRALGEYSLIWGEVDGYNTPQTRTGMLQANGSLRFAETYIARDIPTGTFVLDVNPDTIEARWAIAPAAGGAAFFGIGDATVENVPVGTWVVSWGPVSGWNTPQPNLVAYTLNQDAIVPVSATYSQITDPTGTVVVNPSPDSADASWTLEGPDGFMVSMSGDETMTGRSVGDYTLTWGDAPGYTIPSPATVSGTLTEGGTLEFADTYAEAPVTVTVDPNPNGINAPWTLRDPDGVDHTGNGDTTLNDLSAGSFTVTWGAVSGWNVTGSNPQTFSAIGGESPVVSKTYVQDGPSTGNILVSPEPESASWTITGPGGFNDGASGELLYQGMQPGNYTVSWNDLENYQTPNPSQRTLTLNAGQTITFSGFYLDVNAPSIGNLSGSMTNAGTVTISGDNFGSHSLQVSSSAGPDGWIETNNPGTSFGNLSNASKWDVGISSEPARISTEQAHSGNNSVLARIIRSQGYWQSAMRYTHQNSFDEIWVSFWTWFDPVQTSDSGYSQAKWFRIGDADVNNTCGEIYTTSRWINDTPGIASAQVYCGQTGSGTWDWDLCYDNIYDHEADEPLCATCSCGQPGPNLGACSNENESSADNLPTPRQWTRVTVHAKPSDLNVPNGVFAFSVSKPGQTEEVAVDWSGVLTHSTACTRETTQPWRYFQFQNYFADSFTGDTSLRADFFYDDIYVQIGTRARVEIGDDPEYQNCTHLETQEPTAWSDSGITIKMNHGSYSSGQTVYVFVVRDDGQVSPGISVTLQ